MPSHKIFFIVLFVVLACTSKPLPQLENFDYQVWVADKQGCKGDRLAYKTSLQAQFDQLKGLKETDLILVLGKPDKNELLPRNQKHYSWFIEPGPACSNGPEKNPQKLIIRFTATGFAQEIGFE